jgi:acetyl esterase/lipase
MKKQVLISLFAVMLSCSVYSQSDVMVIWPDKVPDQISEQSPAVISDNDSRNVLRISEVTQPLLEVFKPNADLAIGQAVIVCPGGGYSILALDLEGREVAEWLSSLGYHAFVLQYRVPKNNNGAFQDAQRAIRTVKNLGERFNYKDWKVGIIGFSAGGHLSARTATAFSTESYLAIDAIDTYNPRPDFAALIYPAYLDDSPNRQLSEDISMNDDLPPIFIFGTADDGFGNDALVMAQSLRDAKKPVELHLANSGGHGYGLRKGNPAAEMWPKLLEDWLTQFK